MGVMILFASGTAHANKPLDEWDQRITARFGFEYEDRSQVNNNNFFSSLGYQLSKHFTENVSVLSEARGFLGSGDVNLDAEEGGREAKEFIELRQLYVNYENLIKPGIDLSLGRKRIREDTGMWWDRDYTLGELAYNRSLLSASFILGRELGSLRSDQSGFNIEDEDITHILMSSKWQWLHNHYVDMKYSHMNDRSGRSNTNLLAEDQNDSDLRDIQASWLGVAFSGLFSPNYRSDLRYHVGFTSLSGEVVDYTESGETEKNVDSAALHIEIAAEFDVLLKPSVGMQYFKTTDNNDSRTEGRFFQTGLESNKTKLTGKREYITRFNDAYRPELSNMDVFGVYAGLSLSPSLEVNFLANRFTRVDTALDIGYSRVSSELINGQDDLGSGFDILLSYKPQYKNQWISNSLIRLRLSHFSPGDAYGEGVDNQARLALEWKVSY
jgi:alginate production protein